jgi:hypothetical protein
VEKAACAQFIPLATVLGGPKDGGFADYRPVDHKQRKIREDDGVHLTQNGGKLVTEVILRLLKTSP